MKLMPLALLMLVLVAAFHRDSHLQRPEITRHSGVALAKRSPAHCEEPDSRPVVSPSRLAHDDVVATLRAIVEALKVNHALGCVVLTAQLRQQEETLDAYRTALTKELHWRSDFERACVELGYARAGNIDLATHVEAMKAADRELRAELLRSR